MISPVIFRTQGVVILMLLGYGTCCSQSAKMGNMEIRVDPRVELLSTLCMLAIFDEYRMPERFKPYCDEISQRFDAFKSHEAAAILKELRVSSGISYNAPMGLAVYLKDIRSCKTLLPFDSIPDDLDPRWTKENVSRLLPAIREFAKETDFQGFFDNHSDLYQSAVERASVILNKNEIIPWLDRFLCAVRSG